MSVLQNPHLHFRLMSEDDIDQVYVNEIAAYPHAWTEGILRDCLGAGYSCWVCELDDVLVGHAVMSTAVGEAHVLNICIAPSYQGNGLGRILLRRMMRVAIDKSADTCFLEVRASNKAAIRLYESEGFCEIGLRGNYYPTDDGKFEDARIYAKPLMDEMV